MLGLPGVVPGEAFHSRHSSQKVGNRVMGKFVGIAMALVFLSNASFAAPPHHKHHHHRSHHHHAHPGAAH